ncbi:FMN-binding negative transcriptional regulator [Colwelliaceae bacterium 6441]
MYNPKKFHQEDINKLNGLMVEYPFATLVTHSELEIEAEHIPLYLNQSGDKPVLQGHIAKANPLWKNLNDNAQVLVIFNGPNCYISPNHYPSKQDNPRVVPTWNYVSVQVKGIIRFIHDAQWKLAMLNNLTVQHEAKQAVPWSITDAPQEYTQRMLPAIVGFEIKIKSLQGKWKVSQNQSEENKRGVFVGLSKETESHAQKIAELVQQSMNG